MDNFLQIYQSFIDFPQNIIENSKSIYESGFNIIQKNHDFKINEEILTKLIFLYPTDSFLYYKMACLYKNISIDRAIMWHKMSFSLKPDFSDNFLDLCDILFKMSRFTHILSLNKNNLFDSFMKNSRFLIVYTRSKFSQCQYENGIKNMLYLIQEFSSKKCITYVDKINKYNNYHDTGYIFNALCDHDNALKYIEKALELAHKFDLKTEQKLLSFQGILSICDYLYIDNDVLFKKFLKINDYLPDSPLFSFENKNKNETKNKKIRIGYISSDFIQHSVANFILPILKNHDKGKFDIIIFPNSPFIDPLFSSLKLQTYFINNLNSKEAAKLINKLKIDILFDLNGHTSNNRLDIFTYHPSPIQIAYLGYPNTSGLKSIKYRLTDSIADHPDTTQQFSEQLIRMPDCFLLYDSIHEFSKNIKKLDHNRIILGCVNKEHKTNNHVLNVWKNILILLPNVVLFIKIESFDNVNERTEFYLKHLDVNKDRLIISPKLFNNEFNNLFTKLDILLDPFPYSGTTTTCNSLLHSIPVVTLYNKNCHAHNVSSSLLINCGLPELVAYSENEYIDIVVDLVKNPTKIEEYKKIIRKKFLKLMEPKKFMQKYEDVLTKLYNNDITSFINKQSTQPSEVQVNNIETSELQVNEQIYDSSSITIDFTSEFTYDLSSNISIIEKNIIDKKNVYICGCIRNCANFLENVFLNIDKIIKLFDNYKIIIAYDNNYDSSLDFLIKKQIKYNIELIHVRQNEDITNFQMRSQRISNSRNEILNFIRRENKEDYKYFIMMDMDNVCSSKINIHPLKYHLNNNHSSWDALSFNRKEYYDIWALSIDKYLLSCWHFPGGFTVVNKIKKYIIERLSSVDTYDLLECQSAFNGFAIYKKDKFITSKYDWQIKNIYNYISHKDVIINESEIGQKFTIDKAYHEIIDSSTDCEHRQFHMYATEKTGAKICISPMCLFND